MQVAVRFCYLYTIRKKQCCKSKSIVWMKGGDKYKITEAFPATSRAVQLAMKERVPNCFQAGIKVCCIEIHDQHLRQIISVRGKAADFLLRARISRSYFILMAMQVIGSWHGSLFVVFIQPDCGFCQYYTVYLQPVWTNCLWHSHGLPTMFGHYHALISGLLRLLLLLIVSHGCPGTACFCGG